MKVIIKPYKVNIARILDLQDIILAYKRTYNKVEITNNSIVEMEKEINNTLEESCKYQQNRIKQFKSLLYKYWILQYEGINIPTMYIYPYEINLENNYLFALVSPINDYLFNKNGLFEDSFNNYIYNKSLKDIINTDIWINSNKELSTLKTLNMLR